MHPHLPLVRSSRYGLSDICCVSCRTYYTGGMCGLVLGREEDGGGVLASVSPNLPELPGRLTDLFHVYAARHFLMEFVILPSGKALLSVWYNAERQTLFSDSWMPYRAVCFGWSASVSETRKDDSCVRSCWNCSFGVSIIYPWEHEYASLAFWP